jgi:serine/threonine-protein kinase
MIMIPTQMDRKTFLANLRRSGLISPEEYRELKPRLPDSQRGRVLARALVEWGKLTKFQAELLLAGCTNGFILGQYRILEQLGQGGMGRVFKAMHQTMNRVVAVKVLAPHLVKTEKAQRLFQREVRAAARLIHPNIVTAYDANQLGDRHYLVMEYVDGPNLEQLVRERGPLPVGQACDLMHQIAHGLQHAFEMGMVHRDIKPANLLVQPTGLDGRGPCVAKILDFGLARLHDGEGEATQATIVTRPNVVMGTPDFLSPEQARSLHKVDIRSDLYSLGCTFYYLLTGKVPFPGGNSLEKLLRQSTEEPIPLEQLRLDVHAGVVQVVRRLMAKDPAARFPTPAELDAALAPFAVPGPLHGTAAAKASPFDLPATSTPSEIPFGGELNASGDTPHYGSALTGTQGMQFLPTPISAREMPTFRERRSNHSGRWRFAKIFLAVATAAGLLGGVCWWLLN